MNKIFNALQSANCLLPVAYCIFDAAAIQLYTSKKRGYLKLISRKKICKFDKAGFSLFV